MQQQRNWKEKKNWAGNGGSRHPPKFHMALAGLCLIL